MKCKGCKTRDTFSDKEDFCEICNEEINTHGNTPNFLKGEEPNE